MTTLDESDAMATANRAADEYLRLHRANLGLIPLAVMAEMYDSSYPYHRPMYVDFFRLSRAAQNSVFSRLDFERPGVLSGDFWEELSEVLREHYVSRFPGDRPVFYEGAKYLERAFTVFGSEPIPEMNMTLPDEVVALRPLPNEAMSRAFGSKNVTTVSSNSEYIDAFTDVLAAAFGGQASHPLELMWGNLISSEANVGACYSECVLAGYFAIYKGVELCKNVDEDLGVEELHDYGSPGSWAGEKLETMEDVFLWSLFEIYTNLVLPGMKKEEAAVI